MTVYDQNVTQNSQRHPEGNHYQGIPRYFEGGSDDQYSESDSEGKRKRKNKKDKKEKKSSIKKTVKKIKKNQTRNHHSPEADQKVLRNHVMMMMMKQKLQILS